jgi:hypothetical protein
MLVVCRLQGGDLIGKDVGVTDAAVEALAGDQRELDLGHVEPAAVDREERKSSLRRRRRASSGGNASWRAVGVWLVVGTGGHVNPVGVTD